MRHASGKGRSVVAKASFSVRRLATLLFLVAIVGGVVFASQTAAAELEGAELEEYLIAHSPWTGHLTAGKCQK